MFSGTKDESLPLYDICYENVTKVSKKLSKPETHLSTKNPEYTGKSHEFFQNKERYYLSSKDTVENPVSVQQKTTNSHNVLLVIPVNSRSQTGRGIYFT